MILGIVCAVGCSASGYTKLFLKRLQSSCTLIHVQYLTCALKRRRAEWSSALAPKINSPWRLCIISEPRKTPIRLHLISSEEAFIGKLPLDKWTKYDEHRSTRKEVNFYFVEMEICRVWLCNTMFLKRYKLLLSTT